MSRRITFQGQEIIILEPTPDSVCELCGVVEELRPYGPDFKLICWNCAKKDIIGTERRMSIILFGEAKD